MDAITLAKTVVGATTLDNFYHGNITFHLPTNEMLKDFGLPSIEEVDEWEFDSSGASLSDLGLDVEYDKETDTWLDSQGREIPEEAEMELISADEWARAAGTKKKAMEEIFSTLELALETFSDWSYEYEDDMGNFYEGKAKGIVSQEVTYEEVTIVANTDLVHILHDAMSGAGYFSPQNNLDGQPIGDYIKDRFHWMASLFEVYGMNKPTPNFKYVDDFDVKYWEDLVRETEKQYALSLL